jgi:hypothetical protein
VSATPCGAYDVRYEIDQAGVAAYYDHATGRLAAIQANGDATALDNPTEPAGPCLGGPSDFAQPSCFGGLLVCTLPLDGGADASDASHD